MLGNMQILASACYRDACVGFLKLSTVLRFSPTILVGVNISGNRCFCAMQLTGAQSRVNPVSSSPVTRMRTSTLMDEWMMHLKKKGIAAYFD